MKEVILCVQAYVSGLQRGLPSEAKYQLLYIETFRRQTFRRQVTLMPESRATV